MFPEARGNEAFEQVVDALLRGDYERAETLAREVHEMSESEEKPAARNLLGMVLGQAGRYDEAIVLFRENAEADPEDVGAFANWGEALRRAGRYEEALSPLERTIELQPESTHYQLKLRLARIDAGQEEMVAQEAERRLRESPPPVDWLIIAAAIELSRERWESAGELLRRARMILNPQVFGEILQDPAFARHSENPSVQEHFPQLQAVPGTGALTQAAIEAYASRNFEKAWELLERASEAGENQAPVLTMQGAILMRQDLFTEAVEAYEGAIAETPGKTSLYLNYGEALRASGRPRDAAVAFQRGLRMDPGNEFIATKLAFALIEDGQGEEVFEVGLKDAQTGPLLIGRAAAAASLGKLDVASELLEKAGESLPPEVLHGFLRDPVFESFRDQEPISNFFPGG